MCNIFVASFTMCNPFIASFTMCNPFIASFTLCNTFIASFTYYSKNHLIRKIIADFSFFYSGFHPVVLRLDTRYASDPDALWCIENGKAISKRWFLEVLAQYLPEYDVTGHSF